MYVYCSTIYNSKDMHATQMPINGRLDKENVVHIYHGILFSHKKEQDYVFCRNMNGAGGFYPCKLNRNIKPDTEYSHLSGS